MHLLNNKDAVYIIFHVGRLSFTNEFLIHTCVLQCCKENLDSFFLVKKADADALMATVYLLDLFQTCILFKASQNTFLSSFSTPTEWLISFLKAGWINRSLA